MRLICPNCSAQYEVPADVIPDEGRDVQCSNCQETWFQTHPDTEPQTDVVQTLKEHFAQTEPEAAPIPPQSDAISEPDPIDDEFERALDQELDTVAEDASEIAPSPSIMHERSERFMEFSKNRTGPVGQKMFFNFDNGVGFDEMRYKRDLMNEELIREEREKLKSEEDAFDKLFNSLPSEAETVEAVEE